MLWIEQVQQLEAALAASEAGAARREVQLQVRLRELLVSLSAHIASLEVRTRRPGGTAGGATGREGDLG